MGTGMGAKPEISTSLVTVWAIRSTKALCLEGC